MNLSKENIVSYLLNETARCSLSGTSLRYVANDYFMHDSDRVFFGSLVLPSSTTLKSGGGTYFPSPLPMQYIKQSNIMINLIIMY